MSTFDIVCKASAGTGASAGAAASGATVETIGAKAAAVEHTTAARSWRAIFNNRKSARGRRVSGLAAIGLICLICLCLRLGEDDGRPPRRMASELLQQQERARCHGEA
mmetsp:Transcript_10005/g.26506  ORF Transcript_10005/g.26506 Transcript_10005/m.26506 type:complete len:108 (-) Transcript_10005:211-534(-)